MKKIRSPGFHGVPGWRAQQGAVLLFCLIFLVILTLMAVTGMDTTIVEERMASNMQDYNQAFQAAEVGLDDAEAWLAGRITLPGTSTSGTPTVWPGSGPDPDTDNVDWWWERNADWWDEKSLDSAGLDEVSAQPQYIIEQFYTSTEGQSLLIGTGELPNTRVVHRVTSRGLGSSDTAQVLLQSTYIRPYD